MTSSPLFTPESVLAAAFGEHDFIGHIGDQEVPCMARTRLYLIRHGEQDSASDHAADGGLSQLGREQADRLGRRLRTVPFSAIHHSPLARAAQTADVVAGYLPRVPRHDCVFAADRTPVPSAGQRGQ